MGRKPRLATYDPNAIYGRLTPIANYSQSGTEGKMLLCVCQCGNLKAVHTKSLLNGATSSCGCLAAELKVLRASHGHARKGQKSREYLSFMGMWMRCTWPQHEKWHRYGGRGVTVTERWRSFETFLSDMGPRPLGKSLDRYPNPDGNYEPGNCRWATPKEQRANQGRQIRETDSPKDHRSTA